MMCNNECKPIVKLISYNSGALDVIEQAAAVCYDSKPTSKYYIMNDCISNGHTSVTEYATFVFEIRGVSRALLAQLTRHRIGCSFTVRSQRYCNEDQFNYVIPLTIKNKECAKVEYIKLMNTINETYKYLQELGVPNEDARYVLPNACETVLTCSFNLRSLMHFLNERLCTRAQWEIRYIARAMRDLVLGIYPQLKSNLVPKCESNKIPFCPEKKSCGRHPKLEQLVNVQSTEPQKSADDFSDDLVVDNLDIIVK